MAKATKKRAPDWAALRSEFVHGAMTLRQLAEAHKLNESTVRNRASREGWQADRDTLRQSATQAADASLVERRADELAKFNEDDLRIAQLIRRKAEIMLDKVDSPAELKAAAGAAAEAQKIGRLALGAATESSELTGKGGAPLMAGPIVIGGAHDQPGTE